MAYTQNLSRKIIPDSFKAGITRLDIFKEITLGLAASVAILGITGKLLSTTFKDENCLPIIQCNLIQKKPIVLGFSVLLTGFGLFAIERGVRLDKKLLHYQKAMNAIETNLDMGYEHGLNNIASEAEVTQFLKTAKSFIPVIPIIQELANAGLDYEYQASIAEGKGLGGIVKLKAFESAHQKQLLLEQDLMQQQSMLLQNAEVTPNLPENAMRIMRVAKLPKMQLPMEWKETAIAPNVVREIFSMPAGMDRLNAFESELKLEFGSDVLCGIHSAGKVFIEIPRLDREFPVLPDRQWKKGEAKVVLGCNTKGEIEFDLTSETNPHFLIGGTTGGGKTFSVLRPMVYSLLRQGCEVIVVGGKRFDYEDFINKYGLKFYDNEYAHIWAADFARECGELRKSTLEQINNQQRRILVIDEYSATVMATIAEAGHIATESEASESSDPKKLVKEMVAEYDRNLSEVARIGRALKRHLILATQRVALRGTNDPDGIPHVVRANLPARIAIKCVSGNEGNLILPTNGDRAVSLLGRGDAIVMAGAVNERYQGYAVPISTSAPTA